MPHDIVTKTTARNQINAFLDAQNIAFSGLKAHKASESYLIDHANNVFLDLASQSPYNLLGHNLHEVQTHILRQLRESHEPIHLPHDHKTTLNLCQTIQKHLPKEESWSTELLESDTLAIDKALYNAFQYWHSQNETQRKTILTFAHADHGNLLSSINLNASFNHNNHFQDFSIPSEHMPYPNTWFLDDHVDRKEAFALERLQEYLTENHEKCAAFMIEPLLQSKNGMQACRPAFLDKAMTLAKQFNILIISDERYLSPMRSGKFFANQHLSSTPDIIIIGSTFCNHTLPFGAVITTDRIQKHCTDNMPRNVNRIVCSAIEATLSLLNTRPYLKHIQALQQTHMQRLSQLHKKPIVEHIRYLGSIGAFDIICENRSKQADLIAWFYEQCQKKNILLQNQEKSICLTPPLCLSIDDLHQCYDHIEDIMKNMPLQYITHAINA